jgi:hypothetical protein
MTWQS